MTGSKKPLCLRTGAFCVSQYRPVLSACALSRTLAGRAFAPKSTPLQAKVPVCADEAMISNKLSLVPTFKRLVWNRVATGTLDSYLETAMVRTEPVLA